ncbi:MAG: PspC domain-containing protein [Anaerolineae bacterium]|nr:PspC domain-containing protein [Anaerolineae bacterium]
MSESRLTRSETDKMVAGVCGGIAAYLDIDSVFIRLAFVLLLFASGIGVAIYLIMWIVMPREATVTASDAVVMQDNIKDLKATVSSGAGKMSKPATIGLIMIMLGAYFLLTQLGITGWMSGALIPVLIVGAGIYLLWKRSQA